MARSIQRINNTNTTRAASLMGVAPQRTFRQVHNIHEVVFTNEMEKHQRTAKYLERTDKVYKPSQTIEFNREGELLLFSCDNIKHSTIYLKYPYCLYDSMIPVSIYLFFINPFNWYWSVTLPFMYSMICGAWIPHALYWKHIDRKIHQIYLLRGGKYCRVVRMDMMNAKKYSWITNYEINTLTEDRKSFAEEGVTDFMGKSGQLRYEVATQVDNFMENGVNHNDETLFFMREGTVHQPEIFEKVLDGFNIDTDDFVINTENNIRHNEPTNNM